MDAAMTTPRIKALQAKLAARTNPDGTPKANFHENVKAIKAEIARLEGKRGQDAE